MNKQKKRKNIAFNKMFEANNKEKKRYKATKEQVLSLWMDINEKEKRISERNQVIDKLKKQVKNLYLNNIKKKEKLAHAKQKTNTLQESI